MIIQILQGVKLWIVLRLEVKYGIRSRRKTGDKTQTIRLDATQFIPSKPEEVKLVPEQGTSKVFW